MEAYISCDRITKLTINLLEIFNPPLPKHFSTPIKY